MTAGTLPKLEKFLLTLDPDTGGVTYRTDWFTIVNGEKVGYAEVEEYAHVADADTMGADVLNHYDNARAFFEDEEGLALTLPEEAGGDRYQFPEPVV